MDFQGVNNFSLLGLTDINVILGKNGCGKSFLLKNFEQRLPASQAISLIRYISPERAGQLMYEPSIEQSIGRNPNWMPENRRQNQSGNFREQSATLFRRLEMNVLRERERLAREGVHEAEFFDKIIDKINDLLERVSLQRDPQRGFAIIDKASNNIQHPNSLSSGEAELISLGIEFLSFSYEADKEGINVLLIDEPDVHLHPDLQHRLASFINSLFRDSTVTVIIATHSTSLLAGLAEGGQTNVAFMNRGDQELSFESVTQIDRDILPIFGAHPLSNVFNSHPILLVEGEDDERVWQQAVRSGEGLIKLYPCVTGNVDRMNAYENRVKSVINAVYDDGAAYSLRDRDDGDELIEDDQPIIRMKLSCRAAENLMLSDDVLHLCGTDWDQLEERIRKWVETSAEHQFLPQMQRFVDQGMDRKKHNLKEIRNIIVSLLTNKPWEVLVGQAIAHLAKNGGPVGEHSLKAYLGEKVIQHLLVKRPEHYPSLR